MCAASRQAIAEILKQTREFLEALKDDGVTRIDVPLEAAARMSARRAPQRDAKPAAARPSPRPAVSAASPRPAPSAPAPVPPARPAVSVSSAVSGDPAVAELRRIASVVARCAKCPLNKGRTRTVPGQGNPHPEILFVGEAPGADEDRQGMAFVGDAGQLLTRMIEAMGLARDDVFIANVVKCRPPENRKPLPDEMAACLPYLSEQIAVLRPKVIIALGAVAAHALLAVETPISRLRGQWSRHGDIDLMPTYHPAYLLRNPAAKHEVWADLQAVLKRLGRTPPRRPDKGA